MVIEIIIFWILLIDSLSCNVIVWFGEKWYVKHFRTVSRLFPAGKGWAIYYFILVLWIGTLVYRLAGAM